MTKHADDRSDSAESRYMIPYQIIRSSRKTISIQITTDGQVCVRCPSKMRSEDVHRFVQSKSDWIQKHLRTQRALPKLPAFTADELHALASRALEIIPRQVAHFAPKVGVTYGRISIGNQRSRWGSCSSQGNLNFNCLLMLAPPEVLDYVVVHELCHRKEMNHSKRFWDEVQKILPNYDAQRQWLKENGNSLISRLP